MRCPYCGQPNADNAHNCKRCGKRLDRVREKRKEKNILLYGIFLIAVIVAGGIGAMYAISHALQSGYTDPKPASKVTITSPTPTPVPTQEEEEATEDAEAPEGEAAQETPAASPADTLPLAGTLISADRFAVFQQEGYAPVTIVDSAASSTIYQEGIDNGPHTLYDGEDWSSWQDGVDGDGVGETLHFSFDREYRVRVMALKLGNWYDTDAFYFLNNRPERLILTLGGESFTVTFPDQRTEFYLELTKDVVASDLQIEIGSVYKGTAYDDTCMNEISIYGI